VTEADEARVVEAVERIAEPYGDRTEEFADFVLTIGGWRLSNGSEGLFVKLTEYNPGDRRNRRLTIEQLVERDTPKAKRFVEELAALLGDEFEVSVGTDS
jgi:hypothetical protein